jgi:arylsulfatase A-like enzyme
MIAENIVTRRDFLKLLGSTSLTLLAESNPVTRGMDIPANQPVARPNILILVFDTLSARHMSLHGYARETTPNMAHFAERAFIYHNHYASGNFTSPGTASLLTGVHPWQHRAINLNGIVTQEFQDQNIFSMVNSEFHTAAYTHNPLAGVFLHQFANHIDQYHPMSELSLTGEVFSDRINSSQFPAAFWSETMLRGTDHFLPGSLLVSTLEEKLREGRINLFEKRLGEKYPKGIPSNFKGMHLLLEDAMDWIRVQLDAYPQPFLAYYHLWPPHDPYLPSADYIDIFMDGLLWPKKPGNGFSAGESEAMLHLARQQYDEYLVFTDHEFGRLMDMLAADGRLDDTLIVITSDHGELFERGITGHLNSTLYQDLIQVPLLVSLPGQTERIDIKTPTSCIDLLPTLLQFAGMDVPSYLPGELLPGSGAAPDNHERSIFAMEAKLSSKQDPAGICTLAMINGRHKLVRYLGYQEELDDELYDLDNDPEELENLAPANRRMVADLGAELENRLAKE